MDTGQAGPPSGTDDDSIDVEGIYRRDSAMIRRHAARSGATSDEAEDISQETFVRALTRPPEAEGNGTPGRAWLHTVSGNLTRDGWRRRQRAEAAGSRLAGHERTRAAIQPEDAAVATLEGAQVHRALAKLPDESRRVLVLRIVEGRPAGEVAEIVGRTPEAVRQIQHRALQRLRKELVEMGWDRTASDVLAGADVTRKAGPQR